MDFFTSVFTKIFLKGLTIRIMRVIIYTRGEDMKFKEIEKLIKNNYGSAERNQGRHGFSFGWNRF